MNKWITDKRPNTDRMIVMLWQDSYGNRDFVIGSYDTKRNIYYEHRNFIDLCEDEWVEIPNYGRIIGWMPLPNKDVKFQEGD